MCDVIAPLLLVAPASGPANLFSAEGQAKLAEHLASRSYLVGCEPTAEDHVVFSALEAAGTKLADKHAKRWADHIGSFTPAERAAWPAPVELLTCPRRSFLFDIARQ